jgi:hypothetical protein
MIAELPAVIDYLNDPANEDIVEMLSMSLKDTEFPIGVVVGTQNYDAGDPSSVTADEYVKWYLDPSSNWELPAFEEKWYAVQDAQGTYHVVSPKVNEAEDEAYFMAMYHDEEGNEKLAYLDFTGGVLKEIYLFTDTGYRSILAKDLVGELTVTPILRVMYFIDAYTNIPLSTNSFTISAENADQIRFAYTDISNIPDIADTDGDGDALTRKTVVTDIYGYQIDISDLINNAEPLSITDTDISGIEDKDYTGNEITQELVIMDGDTILVEGQDYEVSYENNVDAGIATIIITGKGKYVDSVILTFKINKAESTICIEPQEVLYSGNAINYQKTKPSVNTGVETNFILWLALMAGASLSAGASGFMLRRKKD